MKKKKKALILFSGQRDSIDTLLNYAEINYNKEINLLYIGNISFRYKQCIPLDMAKEMAIVKSNIKLLYVLDGQSIQEDIIKYLLKELKEIKEIQFLCLSCQICLNIIYVKFSELLEIDDIICNSKILGEYLESILKIIFNNTKIRKECYTIYSKKKNKYINKQNIIQNKCILSYFHQYNFNNFNINNTQIEKKLNEYLKSNSFQFQYKTYKLT